MVCCGVIFRSWMAVAIALSLVAVTSVYLVGDVHSSSFNYFDRRHRDMVMNRRFFAVFKLINNVSVDANYLDESPGYPTTPDVKQSSPYVVASTTPPIRHPIQEYYDDFDFGSPLRQRWTPPTTYRPPTTHRKSETTHWLEEILREQIEKGQRQKNKNNPDMGGRNARPNSVPNEREDFNAREWVYDLHSKRHRKRVHDYDYYKITTTDKTFVEDRDGRNNGREDQSRL